MEPSWPPQNECPEEVARIMRGLRSWTSAKRREAEQAVRRLPPEFIPAQVAALRAVILKRARLGLVAYNWLTCALVFLCFGYLLEQIWHVRIPRGVFGGWLMATYFVAINFSSRSGAYTSALASLEDVHAVGPLAECLPIRGINTGFKRALTRLLPRLRADDRDLLTERQRDCLYRSLGRRFDAYADLGEQIRSAFTAREAEYQLALLKALEQVGDGKAAPYVQRVAAMRPRSLTDVRVIEAAKACLPFLEIRAEEERNADTLLRASDGRSASPDMLLRPADGKVVTEPAHLLRAAQPEADSSNAKVTTDSDTLLVNRKRNP